MLPIAATTDPLILTFTIDGSLLTAAALDVTTVQLFRDGVPIGPCDPNTVGASPDPCVFLRVSLRPSLEFPSGRARITVRSSHASVWNVGGPTRDSTPPTITFIGATSFTVDQTIAITCTAADASGIATTTCPTVAQGLAYTFPLGANTAIATATDTAGNQTSNSVTSTIQVTPTTLCLLTKRLVQDSPKLQSSPTIRGPIDKIKDSACTTLDSVTSSLSPAKKAALVSAHNKSVQQMLDQGFLTQAQADKLRSLAGAL